MNDKIFGRPIRLNQKTLAIKAGKDYAELIFLGDVHYGAETCNKEKFLSMLDYCLKKGIYVLLMGDMVNADLRDSVGAGIYEQRLNPQEQYEHMVEFLKPMAKKGLLVGIHSGNHELRIQKSAGVNIVKAMAKELLIPYLGVACWSLFKVGQERYSVYSLHGQSAARYEGTVLLAAERASVSFNADIFAHGHA